MSARCAGGVTLVELLVALVLGSVVLGAAGQVYLATERFLRLQSSVLEVHQGLRAAMQVLSSDLRELDPTGGDIVGLGSDSISIRATRGLEFVCAPPAPASGRIVVRRGLSIGYRDPDPERDRVLVLREGDPASGDGIEWLDLGIASAGASATCDDGAPATELRLLGAVTGLDSVGIGAPVRWYERVVYRLYADETGAWWLGVRSWSAGAWAALSPVAGPLQPRTGMELSYFDASGAATADPTRVARIRLMLRGVGSEPLPPAGRRSGPWVDSLATVVVPRNGRR